MRVASIATLLACVPAALPAQTVASRGDLEVVDCLLPGQVRQLGNRTYLTQRRPTRTTASDCRIKGGEYVAYDRADLRSALNVWLPAAEAGDAEAQANVGEIYERGIGGTPNFEAAALWYRKAADQGLSRALFNLGTLYEQGFGVEQDRLTALNLYRQAWGIRDNDLLYQDAVTRQQSQLRAELEKKIAERDAEIATLEKQVTDLEARLKREAGTANAGSTEIATLRRIVEQLRAERAASEQRLISLGTARTREPGASSTLPTMESTLEPRTVSGLKLGRYFALVIGNQAYTAIEPLKTPHSDAQRAATLLKDKYGFSVQLIEDADDVQMLRALNELNSVLKPEDNLLIYYAGHGTRLKTAARETGYWLPVNAEAPPKDTFWVPNEQVTAHLGRLPARRVLVVADSCYAGLLSDDPSSLFLRDPGQVSLDYLRFKLPKRARLLISSGGDKPVLDEGGQGNSVFSRAFLDVLEQNRSVLSAPALFFQLQSRVKAAAARSGFDQVPEFKSIKGAGHEIGDFFFVPTRTR